MKKRKATRRGVSQSRKKRFWNQVKCIIILHYGGADEIRNERRIA